jgi:hypothetical protein
MGYNVAMVDAKPVRDDVPPIEEVERVLPQAWCRRTAHKKQFIDTNPAWGQCGATALMVRRLYGGQILKTTVVVPDDWKGYGPEMGRAFRHYYNQLPIGVTVDLTAVQFPFDSKFHAHPDEPRTRNTPFGEDVIRRAILLEKRVWKELGLDWAGPIKQHADAGKVSNLDWHGRKETEDHGAIGSQPDYSELMSPRVV